MDKDKYIGKKYGRLTITDVFKDKKGNIRCTCLCDCGNTHEASFSNLKYGNVKSCGCLVREWCKTGNAHKKHNGRGSRIYTIWKGMRERCNTSTNVNYKKYGARGISVCKEWDDFVTFRNWAYLNGYNETLTLDRIDNSGNYEPSNCRWATYKEQANNRRTNTIYELNGETHTLSEWSDIYGIDPKLVYSRLRKRGWDLERALTQPVQKHKKEFV